MHQAERRPDHAPSPEVKPDVSERDDKVPLDTLALGQDPTAPTHHGRRWSLAIVTVLASITALAMVGAQDHHELAAVESLPTPLNILVLGDGSAGSEGCANCLSYVDQLAAAESDEGRRRIRVDDKTMSDQTAPPSMPTLVEGLRSTPELRSAVAKADVILLAVGNGDVTHCPMSRRTPCPAKPVPQLRQSLTDWMAETEAIRHHRPVKLRLITPPPTSGSPRQNDVARTACEIAAARDAECVNVYDLARTDQHIVAARADSSRPHLTQHGHDLVATQLIAIGIA